MTIFEAIEHIKKRPKMYFTDPISLGLVDAYILGFMNNVKEDQLISPNGMRFEYFNSWLSGTISTTEPEEYGWRRRIEEVSKCDKESLELFFNLIKKFSHGKVTNSPEETAPISLEWSRGTGKMKLDQFQKIKETVVRFDILKHEDSKTTFRIGYNENSFRVYVEPQLNGKSLHVLKFTEIEKNY